MVLLLRMRLRGGHVLENFGGEAQSPPGGQRVSQMHVGHMQIAPPVLVRGTDGVHHGPSHLFQELAQKNGFNFHGGLQATAIIACFPFGQCLLLQPIQWLGQLEMLS